MTPEVVTPVATPCDEGVSPRAMAVGRSLWVVCITHDFWDFLLARSTPRAWVEVARDTDSGFAVARTTNGAPYVAYWTVDEAFRTWQPDMRPGRFEDHPPIPKDDRDSGAFGEIPFRDGWATWAFHRVPDEIRPARDAHGFYLYWLRGDVWTREELPVRRGYHTNLDMAVHQDALYFVIDNMPGVEVYRWAPEDGWSTLPVEVEGTARQESLESCGGTLWLVMTLEATDGALRHELYRVGETVERVSGIDLGVDAMLQFPVCHRGELYFAGRVGPATWVWRVEADEAVPVAALEFEPNGPHRSLTIWRDQACITDGKHLYCGPLDRR